MAEVVSNSWTWKAIHDFFRGMPVAHHVKKSGLVCFWLYEQLQSPPIGLRKIFIDYFFFQADQRDCTKSLSTFEGWDGLLTSEILQDSGKSGEAT